MSTGYVTFLSVMGARTLVVFVALLAALRFAGKRHLGQMNVYDLAMIMAMANAVQNAMTRGSGNLSVGLVSSGVLLVVSYGLARLFVRLPTLEERLVGSPTLLVSEGKILRDRLRREHITEDELMAVLRSHGLADPRDVKMAILEVDGTLSVVPKANRKQGR